MRLDERFVKASIVCLCAEVHIDSHMTHTRSFLLQALGENEKAREVLECALKEDAVSVVRCSTSNMSVSLTFRHVVVVTEQRQAHAAAHRTHLQSHSHRRRRYDVTVRSRHQHGRGARVSRRFLAAKTRVPRRLRK